MAEPSKELFEVLESAKARVAYLCEGGETSEEDFEAALQVGVLMHLCACGCIRGQQQVCMFATIHTTRT